MANFKLNAIVVGGGAAGFFAAIACAEAHPQTHVTLLEAGHQPLSKVRISGGGRCNVTHACFDPAALVQFYPRGGRALRGAFSRFQPQDTIAWFAQRGVVLKTEADGRMFPTTDDSETIVECLLQTARRAGVEVRTGAAVTKVTVREDAQSQFQVVLRSGEILRGDRLLLATGSSPQGHQIARQLGHRIEPPVPSLFTFTIAEPSLRALAGVAVDPVQVRLTVPGQKPLEQTGAVLVTHWGLSGPAILKLSAWGARLLHESRYRAILQINWLPPLKPDAVRQQLLDAKQQHPKRLIGTYCPFALPRRFWNYLIARAGIAANSRWADLSKASVHSLVSELTQGNYALQGKGVFKEEFVTCGGVCLTEVNFKTMESRCCPGLFLAGEVLDIDGVTGGFNFQSAWTTGWIAGQAMGQVVEASQASPRLVPVQPTQQR